MNKGRVIVLVDLDCFYCQVEQRRLGIPRDVPVAVQQWDGLIAVNYSARAAGVTRHMRVKEAREKCPSLQLVHVQTIGAEGDSSPVEAEALQQQQQPDGGAAPLQQQQQKQQDGGAGPLQQQQQQQDGNAAPQQQQQQRQQQQQQQQQQREPNRAAAELQEPSAAEASSRRFSQKACLERYRTASAEVLAAVHRAVPEAIVEKASIDEFYIDLSSLVERELDPTATTTTAAAATAAGTAATGRGGDGAVGYASYEGAEEDDWHEEAAAAGGGRFLPDTYAGQGPAAGGDDWPRVVHYTPVGGGGRTAAVDPVAGFAWGSIVLGGPLQVGNEFERRLAVGAGIVCRIRGAILNQTGFTCSAGIASAKVVAKVASALHKPNQQTVVPPRSVESLMRDLSLPKVRGFGGKLGKELNAMGCATVGQVLDLPRDQLQARLGEERSSWVLGMLRGEVDEPVKGREVPKSMLAAKSFAPTSDPGTLSRWLRILADELAARVCADEAAHHRRAKNLVLHYRTNGSYTDRSISCRMPPPGAGVGAGAAASAIVGAAEGLLAKCSGQGATPNPKPGTGVLPCCITRLALSTTDFAELPPPGAKTIASYFTAAAAPTPAPTPATVSEQPACGDAKTITSYFTVAAPTPAAASDDPPICGNAGDGGHSAKGGAALATGSGAAAAAALSPQPAPQLSAVRRPAAAATGIARYFSEAHAQPTRAAGSCGGGGGGCAFSSGWGQREERQAGGAQEAHGAARGGTHVPPQHVGTTAAGRRHSGVQPGEAEAAAVAAQGRLPAARPSVIDDDGDAGNGGGAGGSRSSSGGGALGTTGGPLGATGGGDGDGGGVDLLAVDVAEQQRILQQIQEQACRAGSRGSSAAAKPRRKRGGAQQQQGRGGASSSKQLRLSSMLFSKPTAGE